MNFLKKIWTKDRGFIGADIVAREPALASGLASFALGMGAHYGLHFSTQQQAYALPISFFIMNWIVRQCVAPLKKTSKTSPSHLTKPASLSHDVIK